MFSESQLNSNPFLRKILEAQKDAGISGPLVASPSGRAHLKKQTQKGQSNLISSHSANKQTKNETVPTNAHPSKKATLATHTIQQLGQPVKPLTAVQFSKTKPTKKQVKEFLSEKLERLNNLDLDSSEDE